MKKNFQIVGLSALVLGNLIGAGILALPISLGLAGMYPSLLLMLVYGAMMLFSAEVLARESAEQHNENFDYPSLYGQYLGKAGKWAAVVTNAIILYGLLIAYISGGAGIIANLCGLDGTPAWLAVVFALILSALTMLDLSVIDRYNTLLIFGLLASFIVLIGLSSSKINVGYLSYSYWEYAGIAIPLVVTASHFHNIIPALSASVKWDMKPLRISMVIGMILAVLMNAAWVFCGLGCLARHGDNSLIVAYRESVPATVPMSNILQSSAFTLVAAIFSITAIATSFLANGVGLLSFVRDILHNTFNINKRWLVRFLTFFPPIVIALLWPKIFIKALDIVGGIGIVTLFGILPCIIALKKKTNSKAFRCTAFVFLLLSVLAFGSVVGGLCGIEFCKPDPTKECVKRHGNTIYQIKKDITTATPEVAK